MIKSCINFFVLYKLLVIVLICLLTIRTLNYIDICLLKIIALTNYKRSTAIEDIQLYNRKYIIFIHKISNMSLNHICLYLK